MNITTPTAVLISGILIAIAVYFKDPTPKYHISKIKLAGYALTRTNIETGDRVIVRLTLTHEHTLSLTP